MSKIYLVNLTKETIAGVFADVETAEKTARRMRHETYLGDAEDLRKNFDLEALQRIVANISPDPDEAQPRTKKAAVERIVAIADELDWSGKVEPRPGKKRSGACAKVWEIANSMPDAPRKDVIAACVEAGINKGTASTQYQKWRHAPSEVA